MDMYGVPLVLGKITYFVVLIPITAKQTRPYLPKVYYAFHISSHANSVDLVRSYKFKVTSPNF